LYGVLNIQSYGVNTFDEENLPIVNLLANQVAIALRNAQLFNDAVLARQEAERANDIKSRFLASMSHELRTPLNAILNFTGFVADGVFGPVNAEQTDALETTLDSGAHLLSLINDVLDLAKVESGAMDMFVEEVDMQALLKSTAATATGLLKNKPVILVVDVDENLPALAGDKRRLRQILLNLVSNAVKYTKEGSITLAAHQHDDRLQISVQDTGIGIAPEDQSLVFESFHQAEGSNSNEFGTGLGLPIAKHFVEAHGGQIWFETEIGVGTTFYVRLPLQRSREQYTISSAQRT
jgi:signal transduction histidine kinase